MLGTPSADAVAITAGIDALEAAARSSIEMPVMAPAPPPRLAGAAARASGRRPRRRRTRTRRTSEWAAAARAARGGLPSSSWIVAKNASLCSRCSRTGRRRSVADTRITGPLSCTDRSVRTSAAVTATARPVTRCSSTSGRRRHDDQRDRPVVGSATSAAHARRRRAARRRGRPCRRAGRTPPRRNSHEVLVQHAPTPSCGSVRKFFAAVATRHSGTGSSRWSPSRSTGGSNTIEPNPGGPHHDHHRSVDDRRAVVRARRARPVPRHPQGHPRRAVRASRTPAGSVDPDRPHGRAALAGHVSRRRRRCSSRTHTTRTRIIDPRCSRRTSPTSPSRSPRPRRARGRFARIADLAVERRSTPPPTTDAGQSHLLYLELASFTGAATSRTRTSRSGS